MFADGLQDIKFSNNQVYLLRKQSLTSKQVEEQIVNYPYTGFKHLRKREFDDVKIPPIISSFYTYLFLQNKIPSSDELISLYILQYFKPLKENLYLIKEEYDQTNERIQFELNVIKARVLRTYPSLIRDFHFYLLCCESDHFEKVYYSLKTDFYEGIDIEVIYKKEKYGISLHTKTKESLHFKKRKYNRHDYKGIKEIDLTLPLNPQKMTGSFFLYEPAHVDEILQTIHKSQYIYH